MPDDMNPLVRRRHLQHLAGFIRGHRHRLFAEDVRPSLQSRQSHRGVIDRRRGNPDKVQLMGIQHGLPVVISMRHTKEISRRAGAVHTGAGNRYNFHIRDELERGQISRPRKAGSDDRSFNRHSVGILILTTDRVLSIPVRPHPGSAIPLRNNCGRSRHRWHHPQNPRASPP